MTNFTDAMEVAGTRATADGYLVADARAVRTGVQIYAGHEVDRPDLATVRIFRPAEEVFAADSLHSFSHAPVSIDHPAEAITADNWRNHAVGETSGEVLRDGDWLRIPLILKDRSAIDAVRSGKRQLSAGYTCELDWTAGVTASGEAYDAVQRRIRGNHLAIVKQARAGAMARIGDSSMSMTLDEAARLPKYDAYRGLFDDGGMPLDRVMAARDLADASPAGQAAADAYSQMVADMCGAHRVLASPAPENVAGPVATNDADAARARMIADLQSQYRSA